MDRKLVAWARAVKARHGRVAPPPLWLFSDARAQPDLAAAVARLPRGLCGVVFRHDGQPGRAALGRTIERICRDRRLALSVAGDWRLAALLHAGLHLRDGRRSGSPPVWLAAETASAHTGGDVFRARKARVAFVSPVFPTNSHPGAAGLGVVRWASMIRVLGTNAAALGGIDGEMVGRFGARRPHAIGAIKALS